MNPCALGNVSLLLPSPHNILHCSFVLMSEVNLEGTWRKGNKRNRSEQQAWVYTYQSFGLKRSWDADTVG